MALDFSKFILKPDFSGFEKLPEYSAAGAKAADKSKQDLAFQKTIESQFGKVTPYLDPHQLFSNEQTNLINNEVENAKQEVKDYIAAGGSYYGGLNLASEKLRPIISKRTALKTADLAYDNILKANKNKSYIDQNKFHDNFVKYFFRNPDGTFKEDVGSFLLTKDGDIDAHLNDMLNESADIYNTAGFVDILKKSKGNEETYSSQNRDKSGYATGSETKFTVPNNLFTVVNHSSDPNKPDYEPVVKGTISTISDPKVSEIFHGLIKDGDTDQDFNVMDDAAFNSSITDEGVKAYIDQQSRNFEKAMTDKGVQVKDPSTNQYTQEYLDNLNKFQKATAFQVFTDVYNTHGGSSIKATSYKKFKTPSQPKKSSSSGSTSKEAFKNDFYTVMDQHEADAEGYKSIRDAFAGYQDNLGVRYGLYDDIRIGYNKSDKTWHVKFFNRKIGSTTPEVVKTMTLPEFSVSRLTTDASASDREQMGNLKDWAKDHTPKKTPKLH